MILRAIAKDPNDRFADAHSFSRELLVMMGKMCLPLDYLASPSDIALALTEPRSRVTAVGARGGRATESATTVADPRAAPAARPQDEPEPRISVREVLLSAAAFAAVAVGVAMWFAH